ncbi:hypothetical protein HWV00_04430 [Moritella sp. 24]|uniref:hypothetical protein n=1 Tax=Moritella sp. 24 TaxID=2746230 RepID=UPI001BA4D829|nr:hypothetical protein [Moritella sp. 24]QUM75541.1 hypothetical protein HWV00_04430 [Moritella sp. 24]
MLYMMNTRNYKHAELFGIPNAVYDRHLNPSDFSYKVLKNNARPGDNAIVIKYADALKQEVIIDKVLITNTCVANYVDGSHKDCLVVLGDILSSEQITKVEASQTAAYSKFFDKNGNFKTGKAVQFSAEL